ncbi:hypothetical protein GVO57_13490 [Sphingomonas changnyeongensis]|uniref:MobA/MobL protein domain-containing protein n=1 Tax=Sphingomonas changnyeongensis TaxID=2698679 RepID=A0A7Z2NYH7_9SPHN|nr:hypothetical protein [Sphingomonas changnyeongensis]QHL91624.1 hypothetical protein GVO57_13490 [Sphingomonas changnyeongensis]
MAKHRWKTPAAARGPEPAAPRPVTHVPPARLRTFPDGGGVFDDFGFVRGYYVGEGPRTGLLDYVERKLCPVPDTAGSHRHTAPKIDLLLPPRASSDYMAIEHLVRMYELALPGWEASAFAQITLRFPHAANFHVPWELARGFAHAVLVGAREVPVIAILHTPSVSGSPNPPHVHLIALPRRLGQFGFAEFDRELPTDIGNRAMHAAWQHYREAQDSRPCPSDLPAAVPRRPSSGSLAHRAR